MPKAKARTVTPLSHGMVLLASFRNRAGLARSVRAIGNFLQALAIRTQCRRCRLFSLLHEHDGELIDALLYFLPQRCRRSKWTDDETGQRQGAQDRERRAERHR